MAKYQRAKNMICIFEFGNGVAILNQDTNIQSQLKQLKQKLYDLSARNPLVNVTANKLWIINDENSKTAQSIYKKQNYFKKEYGLDTVLLVSHFIRWKSPKKDKFYTSPLLYQASNLIKNQKISLQFEVNTQNNLIQINPILVDEFKTLFNIDLQLIDENVNQFITNLIKTLEQNGDKISRNKSFNSYDNWQIIELNAVGNFNYKKSVLAQDYIEFSKRPNQSIQQIFGESIEPNNHSNIHLQLPLSDQSQQIAIKSAFIQNTVIQGPPGTGKSHTIVELIKQNLLHGKKVLFVSEKKSALDVVYGKLKQDKLTHLIAYFNAEKNQKKEFYNHLKQSVEFKIDVAELPEHTNKKLNEFNNYFNEYSSLNTKINENTPPIFKLVCYLAKHQVNDFEFDTTTLVPNYATWYNYIEFLIDIEHIANTNFKTDTISKLPFISLNKSAFVGDNPLSKIETRLTELNNWQTKIQTTLKQYNLNWNWAELIKYCLAASVLQLANKSQLDSLDPNTKAYKSFNNWTKKYELTQNKLKLQSELCAKWEKKPKLAEIDPLIDEIEQQKNKKWYQFFKVSKIDKVFSDYGLNLSDDLKIRALNDLKKEYILVHELKEIQLKLKHNLNILNPETDIDNLLRLRQKLDSLSPNQYVFILEHEQSLKLIDDLHKLHQYIQQTNQIIKFLFVDFKIDNLDAFSNKIKNVKKESAKFVHYLPEIKKTLNLPHDLLKFIKLNNQSISELTHIVVYHNYLNAVSFNPTLKQLESIDILPNYRLLKQSKNETNAHILTKINRISTDSRKKMEDLLMTPASKLNDKQKTNKKKQKLAKRIIYHEIAKQQQHLAVKQLVKQTDYSILDTLPLWIMNPLTIAENLPCDANLFDVVIFDESSQIPLEDALPAIYRAKKVVVVGDSKQMPPSQFFSGSTESTTLLNQAGSVFKSHLLTWHYRSQHPKLMEFSNTNFYDNELCYFPSASNNNPIELVYVKDGVFENGINKNEAKIVAQQYQKLLKTGINDIAIIAFSKTQEKEIEDQINTLNLPFNSHLLIRNLENAQGIERDIVIISIGYAYNPEGVFRLNFGPINQDYGANRLNVLLTRAKQKMIVCTSVQSTDFKLTDNRGVQLVKDFLSFNEQQDNNINTSTHNFILNEVKRIINTKNVVFNKSINGLAVNCFIQHSTQKILLIDPSLHETDNKDIYTILSVLNDRFKHIKIILSHDYWHNKTRCLNEIEAFFSEK